MHARSAHSRKAMRAISAAMPSVPVLLLASMLRYPTMLYGHCLTAPASLLCLFIELTWAQMGHMRFALVVDGAVVFGPHLR